MYLDKGSSIFQLVFGLSAYISTVHHLHRTSYHRVIETIAKDALGRDIQDEHEHKVIDMLWRTVKASTFLSWSYYGFNISLCAVLISSFAALVQGSMVTPVHIPAWSFWLYSIYALLVLPAWYYTHDKAIKKLLRLLESHTLDDHGRKLVQKMVETQIYLDDFRKEMGALDRQKARIYLSIYKRKFRLVFNPLGTINSICRNVYCDWLIWRHSN